MKHILLLVMAFSVFSAYAQDVDSLVDTRDGQVYKTKKIGDKVWMVENLNYAIEKSWCYKNNPKNGETYGRLYSWDAAMKACPTGWHLASDDDWKDLEKSLGMPENDLNKTNTWRGTNQGTVLLSDTTVGFNILLGGYRNPPSNYYTMDIQAFFWTSTEIGGQAYMRQFYNKSSQIFRKERPHSWDFSVRCVKDE